MMKRSPPRTLASALLVGLVSLVPAVASGQQMLPERLLPERLLPAEGSAAASLETRRASGLTIGFRVMWGPEGRPDLSREQIRSQIVRGTLGGVATGTLTGLTTTLATGEPAGALVGFMYGWVFGSGTTVFLVGRDEEQTASLLAVLAGSVAGIVVSAPLLILGPAALAGPSVGASGAYYLTRRFRIEPNELRGRGP